MEGKEKPPLQHHVQEHGPQHGEGCHGLEPDLQLVLSVQTDEDLAQGGTELEVGGQVQHGNQGHEVAHQGCGSDKYM